MADVVFANCNLSELVAALGLTDQSQVVEAPDEARLLITALAERGIEATSAAWNDPDITWEAHRLCILRSPWTAALQPDTFLAWAWHVTQRTDLVNPLALVEWNLHKRYLLELARLGIPTVPTELLTHDEAGTIRGVTDRHGWQDIIVKPAISAGSIGVGRFHPDDRAAQSHIARLLSAGDVLVQPYASAIEQRGELSLVFINHTFSHAIHKQPRAGDYRAQPHLGIDLVPCDPTDAEIAIATAALDAIPGAPMYARIDLVVYDDAPVLMELELIDPYLYLDHVPAGLDRFTSAVEQRLSGW
jgi:hypothetical protein